MALLLKRLGAELTANTDTPGLQWFQRIAALPSGGFVIVWNSDRGDGSDYSVKAQLFDADGAKLGGEILVNTSTQLSQLMPSVAALASGGFAVTWTHSFADPAGGGDGSGSAVRGRLFDAGGTPLGPDFLVNTSVANDQLDSVVIGLAGGGFVVSWMDVVQTYSETGYNIRGQMFDAAGAKVGGEFAVNANLQGGQSDAKGVALASGGFVIVWTDQGGNNSGDPIDLRGQIFDAAGNKVGGEFLVPATAAGVQWNPDLAPLPNGGFVVSWQGEDPVSHVYVAQAQMFDAGGARIGPQVTASNAENGVSSVTVTALAGGGFVVGWANSLMPHHYERSVRAQMFDGEGNRLGAQFQVNTAPVFTARLDFATLTSGRIVTTWDDEARDVKAQIFKPPLMGTPLADTLTGTGEDDFIAGLGADDVLAGGGGDDAIEGGAGADRMSGGAGNDVYRVDHAGDAVIELASEGTDEVETILADYALTDHVENLTGTSVAGGVQTLRGNALDNVLTGGAGGDTFHLGPAGNDIVTSAGGDDLLVVDWHDAATPLSISVPLSPDYSGGQNQAYRGAYQDGAGRSVAFTGIERFSLLAGSADDSLAGAGGDDLLDGGGGNDTLSAGAGADLLAGGAGIDTADYSQGPYAVEVVVNLGDSSVLGIGGVLVGPHQAQDFHGGLDTLSGIENVTTGSGWDVVYGDAAANRIDTGYGDDWLVGGAGADTLIGGPGNDVYAVDDAGDAVEEDAGEGMDEIRTALAAYSLAALPNVENLTGTSAAGQTLTGNAGNNVITGGAGNDTLRLYDGGVDTANGGAGNDNLFFIGTLTGADIVNGGAGVDTLVLQGAYGALTLTANVTQIENLSILGGNNTNFGEPGTNRYDYGLTTNDANFAAGVQARINGAALLEGEDFTFDGSAETNASFVVYGGKGKDTLLGGLGNDIFFYAEERFASGDTVNGGPGYDGMFLRGNYTIDFNTPGYTGLFTNIENLTLTSATDERYARGGGTEFDYNLTLSDAIVGAGQTLTVSGALLMATETMILDGSQETDGILRLFGGAAADTLKGGSGADYLHGNLGADTLAGGGGADLFRYDSTAESNAGSLDQILDFTPGTDRFDLTRIDANTLVGGDQAFTWIGSGAFTSSAGQLRAYQNNGAWFVEGDTNGDGVADLVIALTLQGPTALGAGDFVP